VQWETLLMPSFCSLKVTAVKQNETHAERGDVGLYQLRVTSFILPLICLLCLLSTERETCLIEVSIEGKEYEISHYSELPPTVLSQSDNSQANEKHPFLLFSSHYILLLS
jgi:hypothetical protein